MIPLIFSWLAMVSGLGVVYLVAKRMYLIRRTNETFHSNEPSIHMFVKPTIDYSAFRLVTGSRKLGHRLMVITLELLGKLLSLFKFIIIRLEHRFSKIVNSVRGKGSIGKRGSVSLFLKEIEEHKSGLRFTEK